jgi:hypothetical protein
MVNVKRVEFSFSFFALGVERVGLAAGKGLGHRIKRER